MRIIILLHDGALDERTLLRVPRVLSTDNPYDTGLATEVVVDTDTDESTELVRRVLAALPRVNSATASPY